jgi:hypothetical protein
MKEDTIPDILPPELSELFAQFDRENSRRSPGGRPRAMQPDERAAGVTSNPNPASKETNASDRQSNGRFAKGNRGGPGNPFARQVAAFRACLINSVTEEDMQVIVDQLVDWARYGNLQAIKLLFSYLMGTPKPVVEPDELDLHEMHLAHQTAVVAQALQEQEAQTTKPVANEAASLPDGEVGGPAFNSPEVPPAPPVSAPSRNGTNGELCTPTGSEAPSTNRTSEVSAADKSAQPPSTKRPNGDPAAGVSKNRPSANGPKHVRAREPVCGESPGGQAADVDEKRT